MIGVAAILPVNVSAAMGVQPVVHAIRCPDAMTFIVQGIQAQRLPGSSVNTPVMRHCWQVHRTPTSSILHVLCCCFLLLPFFVRLLLRPFQLAQQNRQATAQS